MPVHIILGAADYQSIRTTEPLILGAKPDKDTMAKFTMLGWTIYGRPLVEEGDTAKQFFLKTGHEEFQKLSSLDVLGLVDAGTREDTSIHKDFLQQLTKTPARYHEKRLPSRFLQTRTWQRPDLSVRREN